jgi:rRNA biogenesis protein RRP5
MNLAVGVERPAFLLRVSMNYLLQTDIIAAHAIPLFCCDCSDTPFPHGEYVSCRVMKGIPGQSIVDVSLRSSRIEGDLDDDESPGVADTVHGYVIATNKSGCFVRLARQIQGRVILKELCDGFLPDPETSFPMGRLVVGKVKEVREAQKKPKNKKATDPVKIQVDFDMRESTVLESQQKLGFDDIELQSKHKGTVTRVETYGVFVRLENSDVSGLVHKSECSDNYIKKQLAALYDPGDLVKVLVLKKDSEERRIGFSMKASHFEGDEDSDNDSSVDDGAESDQDMLDAEGSSDDVDDEDELDSDDENFGAKLAAKMQNEADGSTGDDKSDSDSDSEDEEQHNVSSEDEEGDEEKDDKRKVKSPRGLDTDVGFDWGHGGLSASSKKKEDDDTSDDNDESGDSDDDDDGNTKSSHKSRKKQAQRRREELEITRRETALADGTADENP